MRSQPGERERFCRAVVTREQHTEGEHSRTGVSPTPMAFVHMKVALCKTLTIVNCVCKACVIINSSEQMGLYLLGGFPGEEKFLGIFRSVWISREWGAKTSV